MSGGPSGGHGTVHTGASSLLNLTSSFFRMAVSTTDVTVTFHNGHTLRRKSVFNGQIERNIPLSQSWVQLGPFASYYEQPRDGYPFT